MDTFKTEKLAFYQWIYKWVLTNNVSTEGGPVDMPQIAAVLRAMGYKLETVDHISVNKNPTDTTKIEVQCNRSGMRAVLSKQLDSCICPSSETASEGHFWTVSGMGPSSSQDNLNCVDETHSNLIPDLSKEKAMLVRDILTKLFAIISNTDMNFNEGHKTYSNLQRSLSDPHKPALMCQDTWEVDLKTTPPRTSSPLPELNKSLSQISLNNDKEQTLAHILMTIKENLDKAIAILPNQHDNTFTKLNEKQIPDLEDIKKIPSKSERIILIPNVQVNKTPTKLQLQENLVNTPKSSTRSTEKGEFLIPSRIGTFTKKTNTQTPKKNSTTLVRKDTPFSISKKLTLPLSPNIPDRRLSLGAVPKSTNIRTNLNLSACSPSRNNVKSKSGIQSFGFKSSPVSSKSGMASQFKK